MVGGVGRSDPDKEAANGVPLVQGLHQASHLVSIPDVAALELRQRHVAVVDEVEDLRDFHPALPEIRHEQAADDWAATIAG